MINLINRFHAYITLDRSHTELHLAPKHFKSSPFCNVYFISACYWVFLNCTSYTVMFLSRTLRIADNRLCGALIRGMVPADCRMTYQHETWPTIMIALADVVKKLVIRRTAVNF